MSSSWGSHSKLVFDNSGQTEDLTNFPVLVTQNSGRIDYGKTQDNGEDIRFIDGTTGAELKYEIEEWNESGDSLVWVRVPQIDGSSPTDHIWLYYDNGSASDDQDAAGVWTNGYEAVWHLKEAYVAPGDFKDSTLNGRHGSGLGAGGDPTQSTAGKIGNAQSFDGDDGISALGYTGVTGTSSRTISAWFTNNESSDTQTIASYGDQGGAVGEKWTQNLTALDSYRTALFIGGVNENTKGDTTFLNDGLWHYVVITLTDDGSPNLNEVAIYVDGADDGATASSSQAINTTPSSPFRIGHPLNDGNYWLGLIDEVRISNTARSPDWIAAQHLSMTDAFITYE